MGLFDFFKAKSPPNRSSELEQQMQLISLAAFPGGKQQIEEEAAQLHALLRGKLTKDEAKRLLARTKALLVISEDKSKERIVPSIVAAAGNKLTQHEGFLAYQFFTGSAGELFSGGNGSCTESAVVINATSSLAGISAEYQWISNQYGRRDQDWKVVSRSHGSSDDGKYYETFHVELTGGARRTIVFDISSFFGRF